MSQKSKSPTAREAPPPVKIEMSKLEEKIFQKYLISITLLEAKLNTLKEGFADFCHLVSKGKPTTIRNDGLYLTQDAKSEDAQE